MESGDNLEWNSKQNRVKVKFSLVEEQEEIRTVRLVLQKNVDLRIKGSVTGKIYHFPGAGSIQDVDEQDVESMLNKRGGNICSSCSGVPQSPYFAIAN